MNLPPVSQRGLWLLPDSVPSFLRDSTTTRNRSGNVLVKEISRVLCLSFSSSSASSLLHPPTPCRWCSLKRTAGFLTRCENLLLWWRSWRNCESHVSLLPLNTDPPVLNYVSSKPVSARWQTISNHRYRTIRRSQSLASILSFVRNKSRKMCPRSFSVDPFQSPYKENEHRLLRELPVGTLDYSHFRSSDTVRTSLFDFVSSKKERRSRIRKNVRSFLPEVHFASSREERA